MTDHKELATTARRWLDRIQMTPIRDLVRDLADALDPPTKPEPSWHEMISTKKIHPIIYDGVWATNDGAVQKCRNATDAFLDASAELSEKECKIYHEACTLESTINRGIRAGFRAVIEHRKAGRVEE